MQNPMTTSQLMQVADAVAAAIQALVRYDGTKVSMEGESIDLNHFETLDRLNMASQALKKGQDMPPDQRDDVISALRYANIALAIGDKMPILEGGPIGEVAVNFGDAQDRVGAALRIFRSQNGYT